MAVLVFQLLDLLLVFFLHFSASLFEDTDVALHELHLLVHHSLHLLLSRLRMLDETACLLSQVQEQLAIDFVVADILFS